MTESKNKGGRPVKVSVADKKAIIMDFYLNKANGETSIFMRRDIFTLLADYAHSKQMNIKAYDFSRCVEAKDLIKSLAEQSNDTTNLACAFEETDIDWFLRECIPIQLRRQKLIEREDYFKRLYLKAAKALESYKTQDFTISELKMKATELEQQLISIASDISQNNKLKKENSYLKKIIREHITDEAALYVASGESHDIKSIQSLIAPESKRPAEISLQPFRPENNTPTKSDIIDIFDYKKTEK